MSCDTKNKLSVYRGDDLLIKVMFPDTAYTPSLADKFRFVVKRSAYDTDIIAIQKNTEDFTISGNNLRFRIFSFDTIDLDSGEYLYDIEITLTNGLVMTVVKGAIFELTGDIATPET